MLVLPAHPSHFGWLRERAQCALTEDFRAIEAVEDDGRIRGMVGYCGWSGNSVQAHMAVDHPIVWRHLLPEVFRYPFEHVQVLVGIIPAVNVPSLNMARSLGFREAHRIRDGWARGSDLVVFELRREECRWIAQPLRASPRMVKSG